MTALHHHHPSRLDGHDSQDPANSVRMISRPLAILIATGTLIGGFLIGGVVGGHSASEAVDRSIALSDENDELKEQIKLFEDDDESTGGD